MQNRKASDNLSPQKKRNAKTELNFVNFQGDANGVDRSDWLIDRWLKRRDPPMPVGETARRKPNVGRSVRLCATCARVTRVRALRPLTAFAYDSRLPTEQLFADDLAIWRHHARGAGSIRRRTFFAVVASLHHASRRCYQFRALGNVENELRGKRGASYNLSVWNGLSGSRLWNPYRRSTALVTTLATRRRASDPRGLQLESDVRSGKDGSHLSMYISFNSIHFSSLEKNRFCGTEFSYESQSLNSYMSE